MAKNRGLSKGENSEDNNDKIFFDAEEGREGEDEIGFCETGVHRCNEDVA